MAATSHIEHDPTQTTVVPDRQLQRPEMPVQVEPEISRTSRGQDACYPAAAPKSPSGHMKKQKRMSPYIHEHAKVARSPNGESPAPMGKSQILRS